MARLLRLQMYVVSVAIAASASASASAPTGASSCGISPTAEGRAVPLASMRSTTPLYSMEGSGRLVRIDLGTSKNTTLSDHGFEMMPILRPSANGRWLSYSGGRKGMQKTQYWLYDRNKRIDKLVFEHSAWGGGIPSFSPDSRHLLITGGYETRSPNASPAGVYLFDTAAMRLHPVRLPAFESAKPAWVSAAWSRDGKELLILVRNMTAGKGFDYFSYELGTKKVEQLSGRFIRNGSRHEFIRGAKVVPESEQIIPQSELGNRLAWSPDGSWHAQVDESLDDRPYRLLVTGKAGIARPVATGQYEHCGGSSLLISGWLDDRHLLYRNSMSYFIYDAQNGTTAELFSADRSVSFTW